MSRKQTLLKTILICSLMVFSSTVVFAHSNHDHSQLPYKWEFSKNVKKKIERHIGSSNPNGIVGLSRFEQTKLGSYGIKVGNKFSSSIGGVDALIERTTMGVRIIKAKQFIMSNSEWLIPVKHAMKVSNVMQINNNHEGHDHKVRHIEWTFGRKTNKKIAKRIYQTENPVLVGLHSFEQKLLNEYEVNVGNLFYLSIPGHKFVVEMTTSGLNIKINSTNSNVTATGDTNDPGDNV